MCLIVHKPAHVDLTEADFDDFALYNSDGFGLMVAVGGKLTVVKTTDMSKAWSLYLEHGLARETVLHWRMCTHGTKGVENAHPFYISRDIGMVHNGVLSGQRTDAKGRSDTYHFVRDVVRPELEADPTALGSDAYVNGLNRAIGTGNRLAFMESDGRVTIIGKEKGLMVGDMWYSNTYAWSAPRSAGWAPQWAVPAGTRTAVLYVDRVSSQVRDLVQELEDALTGHETVPEVDQWIEILASESTSPVKARVMLWAAYDRMCEEMAELDDVWAPMHRGVR